MRRASSSCAALGFAVAQRRHQTASSSSSSAFQQNIDRTPNEVIADRQERFRWDEHHTLRPHKVHTHDPSDWGRRLTRAAEKKRGALDITQRLRSLDEHAAEREQNLAALRGMQGSAHSSESAGAGGGGPSPPSSIYEEGRLHLSQLFDALHSSRAAMDANRRRACQLTSRDALKATQLRSDALLVAFAAVVADVGTTASTHGGRRLSRDAMALLWCELLHDAELLIRTLQDNPSAFPAAGVAAPTDASPCSEEVITAIYGVYEATFLQRLTTLDGGEGNDAEVNSVGENACEVFLEELFVATHPLIVRAPLLMQQQQQEDLQAVEASSPQNSPQNDFVARRLRAAATAVAERAVSTSNLSSEEGGAALFTSKLHPSHLAKGWTTVLRLRTQERLVEGEAPSRDTVALQGHLTFLLAHEARGLSRAAQEDFARHQGGSQRAMSRISAARSPAGSSVSGPYNHALGSRATSRPVGRDAGEDASPCIVNADEVDGALVALTIALELIPLPGRAVGGDGSGGAAVSVSRAFLDTMELLGFVPNFSIGASTIAPMMHGITSSGLMERPWFLRMAASRLAQKQRIPSSAFGDEETQRHMTSLLLAHDALLLLSRLGGLVGGEEKDLQRILWSIMELRLENLQPGTAATDEPEPSASSLALQYRECRRLRGLVLHTLLNEALPSRAIFSTFSSDVVDGDDANDALAVQPPDCALALLHLLGARATLRKHVWRELVRDAQSCVPIGEMLSCDVAILLLLARGLIRKPQSASGASPKSDVNRVDRDAAAQVELDGEELVLLSALARRGTANVYTTTTAPNGTGSSSTSARLDAAQWVEMLDEHIPAAMRDAMGHPAAPLVDEERCLATLRALVLSA